MLAPQLVWLRFARPILWSRPPTSPSRQEGRLPAAPSLSVVATPERLSRAQIAIWRHWLRVREQGSLRFPAGEVASSRQMLAYQHQSAPSSPEFQLSVVDSLHSPFCGLPASFPS